VLDSFSFALAENRNRLEKNHVDLYGTVVAQPIRGRVVMMSLVRLIGFTTLGCGCVTGKYRELATHREVIYVEEKGVGCAQQSHRRNHTLAPARFGAAIAPVVEIAQAS